jgi:hypothetical protein
LSASSATFKGSCIIEFYNLQQDVRRAATGLSHVNDGTAGASGLTGHFGHVWENSATITTVKLSGNTVDIEAGSFVNVYVYEAMDVSVPAEEPIEPDWYAQLDFIAGEGDEFITLETGNRVLGQEYQQTGLGGTLQLLFEWGEEINIVSVDIAAFYTMGVHSGSDFSFTTPTEAIYSDQAVPTSITYLGEVSVNRNEDESTLLVSGGSGGIVNVSGIIIGGTGTIPTSLATYEI